MVEAGRVITPEIALDTDGNDEIFDRAAMPPSPDEVSAPNCMSSGMYRFGAIALGLLATFMPLFFGAVHPSAEYLFYIAACLSCTLIVLRSREAFAAAFYSEVPTISRTTLLSLLAFVLIAISQGIAYSALRIEHPVLSTTGLLANTGRYFESLLSIVFFIAVFVLTRTLLAASPAFERSLLKMLGAIVIVVCLIALSHWLSDNGKLFWTFEPEFVFQSTRARWPFVNPNHLGHYLLLSSPAVLILLTRQMGRVRRMAHERSPAGHYAPIRALLASRRLQRAFARLSVKALVAIITVLTMIVTLSRSTWFAMLVVGLLLTAAGWARPNLAEHEHHRRRHRSSRSRTPDLIDRLEGLLRFSSTIWKSLVAIAAAALLVVLLNNAGSERVSERIAFGLTSSKDDMRFQFYSDSMALLRQHPLWGVGLGAWNDRYPEVMSEGVAGLNPEFLHSDPLQLLIEVGIIGVLPILYISWIVVAATFRSVLKDNIQSSPLLLCAVGLAALMLASFFDFPLRIPAILLNLAILLGLTTFYLDRSRAAQSIESALR